MERDRRLALSAALARQQVALGIAGGPLVSSLLAGQNGAAPAAAAGDGAAAMAAALQSDVLAATQKLAEQQAGILDLVKATQQQLTEHKVRCNAHGRGRASAWGTGARRLAGRAGR